MKISQNGARIYPRALSLTFRPTWQMCVFTAENRGGNTVWRHVKMAPNFISEHYRWLFVLHDHSPWVIAQNCVCACVCVCACECVRVSVSVSVCYLWNSTVCFSLNWGVSNCVSECECMCVCVCECECVCLSSLEFDSVLLSLLGCP